MRLECEYIRPADKQGALEALAANTEHRRIWPCAGGTDLLIHVRAGMKACSAVLDILHIGLDCLREEADGLHIGAGVSLDTVQRELAGRADGYALLGYTASRVGAWQTRNLATLGGDICTGIPCADMAVSLMALDAVVVAESVSGTRQIPLDVFFEGPHRTALRPDELVTEVFVPQPPLGRQGHAFLKVGRRKELFIAVLNVACALTLEDGSIQRIRLAGGTMAPTPTRLYRTEEFLTGRRPEEAVLEEAAQIMSGEISPRDSYRGSKKYRETVALSVMKRAVRESAYMAGEVAI